MPKLAIFFIFAVFIFPIISFADGDNGGLVSFLNFVSEQIKILREKIFELIQRIKNTKLLPEELPPLSPSPTRQEPVAEKKSPIPSPTFPKKAAPSDFSPQKPATPAIPSQASGALPKEESTPALPRIDLKANGSDGPISVVSGSSVDISWSLSKHNWSYCGRFGGWEGTLPVGNGSLNTKPLSYGATYNLFCYIGSTKYEDSAKVLVTQLEPETVNSPPPPAPTYSLTQGGGFKSCLLEVSRNVVTLGKDAIEAMWTIDSDPRNAFFYWRGKDNGVDIGKVYGGKTQRIRTFGYGAYPAKYERYVEMFFAQDYYIGDPYTPECTTNTVTFEVKQ